MSLTLRVFSIVVLNIVLVRLKNLPLLNYTRLSSLVAVRQNHLAFQHVGSCHLLHWAFAYSYSWMVGASRTLSNVYSHNPTFWASPMCQLYQNAASLNWSFTATAVSLEVMPLCMTSSLLALMQHGNCSVYKVWMLHTKQPKRYVVVEMEKAVVEARKWTQYVKRHLLQ